MSLGTRPGTGALSVTASAPSLLVAAARARLRLYEPIQRRTYWSLAVLSLCLLFGLWAAPSYTGRSKSVPAHTDPGLAGGRNRVEHRHPVARYRGQRSRIVLGFLISSVVAIPVGHAHGSVQGFEAGLEPPIDFMRYTPAVAFIPLTLIWFGTSTTQKLVILFIAIFFQEVLLVMDNVKNVPVQFVDMAYTLGCRRPSAPAGDLRGRIARASWTPCASPWAGVGLTS